MAYKLLKQRNSSIPHQTDTPLNKFDRFHIKLFIRRGRHFTEINFKANQKNIAKITLEGISMLSFFYMYWEYKKIVIYYIINFAYFAYAKIKYCFRNSR